MKNIKPMMLNKKLGVLATAVAAVSTAHAAFDEGNAVLFAYDSADNDTYFVDLGVTGQDLVNATEVNITDSGLASFLGSNAGAQWTVIASVNDTTSVGGPPAAGASLLNSGVVGSSTTGSSVGLSGQDNDTQRATLNDWLAQVQTASAGSSSFGVAGTDPASADAARNGGFFNDSLISVGSTSALFYSQANPADSATLADAALVTQVGTAGTAAQSAASLTAGGEFSANTAVPVPAAAWLFGSALAGLAVVRRRK